MSKRPKNIPIISIKKPKTDPQLIRKSYSEKPKWCFCHLDFSGQWGWGNITSRDDLFEIHQRVRDFETMTWGEIERKRTKKGTPQNHSLERYKICAEAQRRLSEIRLESDTLFSLHVNGRKRIWGIKEGSTFYFLWWDPEHTVYPITLSHT